MEVPWEFEDKHILILSASGKPIFSRVGDENDLVTTFGLLQAMISIVEDQGDRIKCIKAGSRRFVFLLTESLYFVCISNNGEPESILTKQLEFLYDQVLMILTDRVQTIRFSKDLRDLLGPDSIKLMQSACQPSITPPQIAFNAVAGFVMNQKLRCEIGDCLNNIVHKSNAAIGMILEKDKLLSYRVNTDTALSLEASDIVLLTHFVANSTSFTKHDQNWVPICLPKLNASAVLHAYVCTLHFDCSDEFVNTMKEQMARNKESGTHNEDSRPGIDLSLILLSTSLDPAIIKEMHSGREEFSSFITSGEKTVDTLILSRGEKQLDMVTSVLKKTSASKNDNNSNPTKQNILANCLHYFIKHTPLAPGDNSFSLPSQFISSRFEFPLHMPHAQDLIMVHYEHLATCLRAGTASVEGVKEVQEENSNVTLMDGSPSEDHAAAYILLEDGSIVIGLASPRTKSEFYAVFSATSSPQSAVNGAIFLFRTILNSGKTRLFFDS